MRLLIDTQLLIWAGEDVGRLSRAAVALLTDEDNQFLFSAIAIVEIAIKHAQGRRDFPFEPGRVRAALLANEFLELPLSSEHGVRLGQLPPIHKDPFDRLMIAQALAEGVPFVTADRLLAGYPGQVIIV